jgi:hypothetical protein
LAARSRHVKTTSFLHMKIGTFVGVKWGGADFPRRCKFGDVVGVGLFNFKV